MSGVLVPQMAIEGMNFLNILRGRGSDGSVVTLPATIKMIVTPTEVGEEVGIIDIVETLGNDRAIAILTNEPPTRPAHKNTESVNAKLRRRVSSSIRGQLTASKHSVVHIILEAKVACFWKQRILWITERVRCSEILNSTEVHFREICLGIALRFIILGIEADIRCKFVAPGI